MSSEEIEAQLKPVGEAAGTLCVDYRGDKRMRPCKGCRQVPVHADTEYCKSCCDERATESEARMLAQLNPIGEAAVKEFREANGMARPIALEVFVGGNFVHLGTPGYKEKTREVGALSGKAGKIGEVSLDYPFIVTKEAISTAYKWAAADLMYEALKAYKAAEEYRTEGKPSEGWWPLLDIANDLATKAIEAAEGDSK